MSENFNKNELNEENAVPKKENESYVYTEGYENNFQDSNKNGEEVGIREQEKEGEKKETPSDAREDFQAPNEEKKAEEQRENHQEEVSGASQSINGERAEKRNMPLPIW